MVTSDDVFGTLFTGIRFFAMHRAFSLQRNYLTIMFSFIYLYVFLILQNTSIHFLGIALCMLFASPFITLFYTVLIERSLFVNLNPLHTVLWWNCFRWLWLTCCGLLNRCLWYIPLVSVMYYFIDPHYIFCLHPNLIYFPFTFFLLSFCDNFPLFFIAVWLRIFHQFDLFYINLMTLGISEKPYVMCTWLISLHGNANPFLKRKCIKMCSKDGKIF